MGKSKTKPLIIHELRVKNIGPIKEIEVVPKGDVVELTGPNGAGKSTVLDAISYALSGARSFKDIPHVIRKGEEEAEVVVDLGEYRVIREWTGEANYRLKVMAKLEDGNETQISAPQSVLDTFGQTIGVDPLELSDKRNATMRKEFLESFVEEDLDRLDEEYKDTFTKRTDVNRDVKKAKAQKESLDPAPDEVPEKVDISGETKKLQEAQAHNNKVERSKEELEAIERRITTTEEEIARLQEKLEKEKERKAAAEEWIEENPATDVEPIEYRISKAEQISEQHRLVERHQELDKEIKVGEKQSEKLTKELEEITTRKTEAIKAANMPLDGLNLEESDVTIDGQPFLQYSEGERLKFAALMIVGSNPRFRVIPIKEGEKLDSKNMAILKKVCKEHGFQLWIERMDESGEVGFVFNNGEITKQNNK